MGLIRFNCFKGLYKNSFYPSNLISNATYFEPPSLTLVLLQHSYCASGYIPYSSNYLHVFYLILWEMVPLLPCFRNSVQFDQFGCSVLSDSLQPPWTAAHQASLSFPNSQSLLQLIPVELVMPSNQLILCHPLLLLPSIFPSLNVFSNESVPCIRWPKCLGLCIYLIHICIPGLAQTRNTYECVQ